MKIPFGLHKETKRFIGIDEVEKGLRCECICPSCRMKLIARKGDKNIDHFAHYKEAKKGCDYSYWVSIRSMAKQLIEKELYVSLNLKKDNLVTCMPGKQFRFYEAKVDPRIFEYQFDMMIKGSIGNVYIYFLTDEDDIGRARQHYYDNNRYFNDKLILEIDLSCMKEYKHDVSTALKELLFIKTTNKEFLTPNIAFHKEKKEKKSIAHNRIEDSYDDTEYGYYNPKEVNIPSSLTITQAVLYIKAMKNIDKNDGSYDASIFDAIISMKSFYLEGISQCKHISHNTSSDNYEIFYRKGGVFIFGVFSEKYYAIANLNGRHLIYTMYKNDIIILCETKNIKKAHIDIYDYYRGMEAI